MSLNRMLLCGAFFFFTTSATAPERGFSEDSGSRAIDRDSVQTDDRGDARGIASILESLSIQHQESMRWLLDQYNKIDRGDLENVEGLDGIGDYRVQNYWISSPEQRAELQKHANAEITRNAFIILVQQSEQRPKKPSR